MEPTGKSPGFGPKTVAGTGSRLRCSFSRLAIGTSLRTVDWCCAQRAIKPVWQRSIFCVCFEFLLRHSLEQIVQVDLLAPLDELALCIDSRICDDRLNNCCSAHRYIVGLLDNSFKSCSDIPDTLREQVKSVRVTIDCRPIPQFVFGCDLRRAFPADEVSFNFFSARVCTDAAFSLMSGGVRSGWRDCFVAFHWTLLYTIFASNQRPE